MAWDHAARNSLRAQRWETGPVNETRLVMGTALSPQILPEDIGRVAMVEKVAAGVKAAMKDAGIDDPKDVHYVQTKTPLLTIETIQDAHARGQHVFCEVHDLHGRFQWHDGTWHRRRARRNLDAEGRRDLQEPRPLLLRSHTCSSGVELDCARRSCCSATRPARAGALHALAMR